jgi:hypothetical protein
MNSFKDLEGTRGHSPFSVAAGDNHIELIETRFEGRLAEAGEGRTATYESAPIRQGAASPARVSA